MLGVGSPGRARTADPVINSHLLYRLSYRGTVRSGVYYRFGVEGSMQKNR